MTQIRTRIASRIRDIGFPVRRLLPAFEARSVGPFVFLDHMGPAGFAHTGTEGDVRPHPHIGLATVTYLFSGAFMHRDSLGTVQRIEPGAINWMTAGRGVVHSERIPADIRARGEAVEGIQMWVALPQAHEDDAPGFWHHPAGTLPTLTLPGVALRVLVGDAFGLTSPVRTYDRTLFVAAELEADAAFTLPAGHPERAVYVVSGCVTVGGARVEAGTLVVLEPGTDVPVRADTAARLMLVGGDPLDGPRYMWWNFVSSSRARIEQAKADWKADRFEPVPGESEWIPLPEK